MFGIGPLELAVLLTIVVVLPVVAVACVVVAVQHARRQAERRYGPLDPRRRREP